MESEFEEKDFVACCGSTKFAGEMVGAAPFANYEEAVDVNGWLEAFAAHPQIGQPSSANQKKYVRFRISEIVFLILMSSAFASPWSKGEQSTALATATDSSLQELFEWNARYRQKFGFVFLICASGRSTPEILAELKKRYPNRPIVEFEIAAQEQMKVTELRLAKLFSTKVRATFPISSQYVGAPAMKAEEDRVSIIGAHLTSTSEAHARKTSQVPARTRPPITTHVLDVSRGSPAAGIEVRLERWKGTQARPLFSEPDLGGWVFQGSSTTDTDGRSGRLMGIVDSVDPGIYRISFNTGKYSPSGFFPYVSIAFEIKESQRLEHFHVPVLLSPFSFSTYRGS
ncbi:hypothetical protein HHK36_028533 [Tetracentron sinense]|uniref:Hydroxyisourate hydrolase n=1 Tax=Tetracentron sinense TaxID=13715 RepID=A0A834YGI3_TETSI|nr:hypothetical protein HHK36_028533 [Tetracentron sinense]